MDAALRFNIQPWKLVGGSKTLWYARYEAIREAESKRNAKIAKDMERK